MNVILNENYIKLNKYFGEKMKECRMNKNTHVSQEKLAEEIGISRTTLSNYETAKTSPPWWFVCVVSRFFNKKISDFSYYGKEDKDENFS